MFKTALQHPAVRVRACTGGNDTGKAHALCRAGSGEAVDKGGNGSGKPPCPDHKHNWKPEHSGHIQGAAGKGFGISAVQKPHDSLDQDNVCAFGLPLKDIAYAFLAHKPGIKVEAGMAAGLAHEGGINIVRSAFAAVHSVAKTPKRNGKCQGGCCLATAGMRGSQHKCERFSRHDPCSPRLFGQGLQACRHTCPHSHGFRTGNRQRTVSACRL